jgi:NTP pyrophosphatase (non-canonical NTP hydrolase)
MSDQKSNALDRYQEATGRTANHDFAAIIGRMQDNPVLIELANYALGAAGEAGEIADIVKKVVFHGHPLTQEVIGEIVKECGDELWYIARATAALKVKLSKVAGGNIQKLKDRYPEGFDEQKSINREEAPQ